METKQKKLLTIEEVSAYTGLSVEKINDLMASGHFPKAKAISPDDVMWMSHEVDTWNEKPSN